MTSLRRALTLTLATLLAVPAMTLMHPTTAVAAAPDVTEPQLVELEVSPLSVDVSEEAQTISVRARITDDQSGTTTPTMLLSSQSTDQDAGFGQMRLVAGDALDGWYEWSATIPAGAAPGAWDVVLYPLRDARGNGGDFGPPAHFGHVVNVVNPTGADTVPPQLIEFEVTPTAVDVTVAPQAVEVRARITDNHSGTTAPTMSLSSTTTDQSVGFGPMRRVSGTALDGWWEWSVSVPVGSAPGNWDVVLYPLRDARGNGGSFGPPASFSSTVRVINGAGSDVTPPQLVEFEVAPRTIDVADSSQTVSVRARITDNLSGTDTPTMLLSSETTDQSAGFGSMRLVSGNGLDGWYEWSAVVPQGAAPGPWSVVLYPLSDARGNSGSFGPPASFDSMVNVVNFSGDTEPPRLVDLSVTPDVYYTGEPSAQLTVRARVSDDASGAVAPAVTISNDSSSSARVEQQLSLVEGNANNGVYEWTGSLESDAPAGDWSVELAELRDVRGNSRALNSGNLARFEVIAGVKPVAPSAPRSVTAIAHDRSATLSWSAPANNGSAAITSYVIKATPRGESVSVPASTRSASVTDLTNGTAYRFTVTAVSAAGESPASAPSAPVTPMTVPSAPRSVMASAGSGSASISWTAPSSTGGAAISSYTVTASPGGRSVTVPASATTAAIAGLTNGTAYRFTVVAVNAAGSSPASAASNAVTPFASLDRLAGANRYATAASIAERFPDGVETVYVASGTNFPDALAGAALAGSQEAPVLLATRSSVPDATLDALETLDPQRIVMLGGTPTLSDAVARQLAAYGTVTRIAGANRYATAAEISEGFAPGVDTVYVASGASFPDALAGAALAGATDSPVLLTSPRELPDSVRQALERLDPNRIVVLGGTPSVNATVFAQLRDYAPATRIAGGNRFETAALVAAQFDTADRVYVASGTKFPDALAGAALAALNDSPVLLTRHDTLAPSTATATQRLDPAQVVVLGDANSVNNNVATQLQALIH